MRPIFITGIGTDVGKTVAAAIVTEALGAAYWKPVQAGFDQGTDTEWVAARLSHPWARVVPQEAYKLKLPASPHIAARQENIIISLEEIHRQFMEIRANLPVLHGQADPRHPSDIPGWSAPAPGDYFVIEGAGGLLVPLNESEFIIDLIKKLNAIVILVSRNYLGSINHSLLTAAVCKTQDLDLAGWLFNGEPSGYENEIANWSGATWHLPIPWTENPDKAFVREQGQRLRPGLMMMFDLLKGRKGFETP
jgi:dethiobiotin synthetase